MKSTSYTLEQFVKDKPFAENSVLVMDVPDSDYAKKYIIFVFTDYGGFVNGGDGTIVHYKTKRYTDLAGGVRINDRYATIGVNGKKSTFRLPNSEEIEIFKNAFPNDYKKFHLNPPNQNSSYEIY